jgi:hypothetical protein
MMTAVSTKLMRAKDVRRSLSVRDLTDEAQGPHAMQILLREVVEALREAWCCEVLVHRESPIVSVEENYDTLHYPPEGASRDARYTRYLNGRTIFLRIADSKIVERWGEWDALGMMQQLGAFPAPEQSEEASPT